MKICSYNIEWFDNLFEKDNSLKSDDESKKKFSAIEKVLTTINPDLIGIIEAPNHMVNGSKKTVACLENFAVTYSLRTNKAAIGFPSAGQQEIATLYDPNIISIKHTPGGKGKKNPPFNETLEFDTDEDRVKEIYKFYRPPFEFSINSRIIASEIKVIIAHPKSKGIFSSADLIYWERENLRNRRKLFAECTWIRNRVDEWLAQGSKVMVMGDINDGPGMDNYEFRFGKSAVEIILGDIYYPERLLRSHIGRPKWGQYGWDPSSTSFKDRFTETYVNVLIDHILVSQNINVAKDTHIVWNPFQEKLAKPIKSQLLEASDHFPVSIEVE